MTYACPNCRCPLGRPRRDLLCPSCGATYPDRGGFYDFLGDGETQNGDLVSLFDAVSGVYETPLWYPTGMRLATGGRSSADELVGRVARCVSKERPEQVLDVATGTGLFARRLARGATVHGVDASEEMLRRAVRNARRDGVQLELSRADAGSIPHSDDSFDAVTCCGALHLLPEPSEALAEMGRVVRSGGILVATTIVDEGIFSLRAARELAETHGMRAFDLNELDGMLDRAGFERGETKRESSLVTVTARRR